MRVLLPVTAFFMGLFFLASTARPDGLPLTEVETGAYGGGGTSLTAFDPSLGTLDSVDVTITGLLTATFPTVPMLDGNGNPIPMPVVADVYQQFGGPAFSFQTDLFLNGVAPGVGSPMIVTDGYTYSFTVTAADLGTVLLLSQNSVGGNLGGVLLPAEVSTELSDFVSPVPGSDFPLFESDILTAAVDAGPLVYPMILDSGNIVLQYNYTTNAVTTPEPSALTLMLAGLAILFLGTRRFKVAA